MTSEKFDVFPGIINENEFYSHHFFAHVFQARVTDWLAQRFKDEAKDDPATKALTRLAAPFFQEHARYPWDGDFAARLQWHRELHRGLLQALVLPSIPENRTGSAASRCRSGLESAGPPDCRTWSSCRPSIPTGNPVGMSRAPIR